MSRDFVDNDLLKTDAVSAKLEKNKDGHSARPQKGSKRERSLPARTEEDKHQEEAGLVRQKEELANQVAGTTNEIEKLRNRQAYLEKEKQDLQALSRKEEIYEKGKRELMEKLGRSLVLIEKEQAQAVRMGELLVETRARFGEALNHLQEIDESAWTDKDFRQELERALGAVEAARMVYKKGLARIDASSWHKEGPGIRQTKELEPPGDEMLRILKMGFWLKAGLAVSLPLILALIVMFVLWLWLSGMMGPF